MPENKREKWIDFARGFAMILVMIGHCEIPDPFWKSIYMFHMPLFYVISGCLHKKGGYKDIQYKSTLKKWSKAYLLPYFVFSALGLSVSIIFHNLYEVNSFHQVLKYCVGIAVGLGNAKWTGCWGAIWFLISQFFLLVFVQSIEKINNRAIRIFIILTVPLLNIVYDHISFVPVHHWIPWNIGAAFVAVPLFFAGVYLREFLTRISSEGKGTCFVYFVVSLLLIVAGFIVGSTNTCPVTFTSNTYGNLLIMYTSAMMICAGIMVILRIVYLFIPEHVMKACSPVEWVGINSLFFLGTHGMIIPVAKMLQKLMIGTDHWYINFVITLVLSTTVVFLIVKVKREKHFKKNNK